jgi:hypothetical protein
MAENLVIFQLCFSKPWRDDDPKGIGLKKIGAGSGVLIAPRLPERTDFRKSRLTPVDIRQKKSSELEDYRFSTVRRDAKSEANHVSNQGVLRGGAPPVTSV